MDIVQTRLYSFRRNLKFTTTLHHDFRAIKPLAAALAVQPGLATPASLSFAQEPLPLSSLLPVISLFN